MARKKKRTVEFFIELTQNNMKNLGVYKPEYDEIIRVYSTMLYQFEKGYSEFESENYVLTIADDSGKAIQNPMVKYLENLRKDIKTYSDILQLNAKNSSVIVNKTPDKLANIKRPQLKVAK